jgi:hypothetical protein
MNTQVQPLEQRLTVPVIRAVGGVGLLKHAAAAQGGRGGGSSSVDSVTTHESAVCKDQTAPATAQVKLSLWAEVQPFAGDTDLDPCRSPLLAVGEPWLRWPCKIDGPGCPLFCIGVLVYPAADNHVLA